jgi:hypothetical protein
MKTSVRARVLETQTVNRLLLIGGVIGPALFVVVALIEGATRPGYSAWRNYVSSLSLSDKGWEQIANFIVCGLLVFGFSFALRRALGSGKGATAGAVLLGAFGLGLVVAGIFVTDGSLGYPPGAPMGGPQTWHGTIHGLAGLFDFTSLAVVAFLLARRFAGDPAWRGWTAYSIATGVSLLVLFVVFTATSVLDETGVLPNGPTGLLQRVAIVLGWGWIALLALRLLRSTRAAGMAD